MQTSYVHTLVESMESKLFNSVRYNSNHVLHQKNTTAWKKTFTIICDNDLIPLLFLQKTTIWSGRIFCIGCYLGIFTIGVCIVLLYFISPFQCICWKLYILCCIVFVCMLMSWFAFARPNKKLLTYLLTYLLRMFYSFIFLSFFFLFQFLPKFCARFSYLKTNATHLKLWYNVQNGLHSRSSSFRNLISGLLMIPEHSETKTKTETRQCETKIETETEIKNLLWDRDQKLRDRDRDRDQSSQVNCRWK